MSSAPDNWQPAYLAEALAGDDNWQPAYLNEALGLKPAKPQAQVQAAAPKQVRKLTPLEYEKRQELAGAKQDLEQAWFPNVKAAMIGQGLDIISPIARMVGQGEYADQLNRTSEAYEQVIGEQDKGGYVPAIVKRGLRGALRTVPPMIVAGRVAGPYGAIGLAAGQEANRAVTKGRDAGLTGAELGGYVVGQGVVEALPAIAMQRLGLGGLESVVGKAGKDAATTGLAAGLKQAGLSTLQELPEEIVTEIGHNVADAISKVDPKATNPDRLFQTVADTTVQTLITAGMVNAPYVVDSARAAQTQTNQPQVIQPVAQPSNAPAWGMPAEWQPPATQSTAVESQATSLEQPQTPEAAFLQANPEAAQRLMDYPEPSRKVWESAGLPKGTSSKQRRAFVEALRGLVEPTTPQQALGVEGGTPEAQTTSQEGTIKLYRGVSAKAGDNDFAEPFSEVEQTEWDNLLAKADRGEELSTADQKRIGELKDRATQGDKWYTDDPEYARQKAGKGGDVYEVSVPMADAAKWLRPISSATTGTKGDNYAIPFDVHRLAKRNAEPLSIPGEDTRAPQDPKDFRVGDIVELQTGEFAQIAKITKGVRKGEYGIRVKTEDGEFVVEPKRMWNRQLAARTAKAAAPSPLAPAVAPVRTAPAMESSTVSEALPAAGATQEAVPETPAVQQVWDALPDTIKGLDDEGLRTLVNNLNGTKVGKKGAVGKRVKREELLTMAAQALGMAGPKPNVISFKRPPAVEAITQGLPTEAAPTVAESVQPKAPTPEAIAQQSIETGEDVKTLVKKAGILIANPKEFSKQAIAEAKRIEAENRPLLTTPADKAVAAYAQEKGMEPVTFRQAVEEVHQGRKEDFNAKRMAKADAHRLTGISPADMQRLRNSGLDYAATRLGLEGKTGEKLRYFDQYAEEIVNAHPEVFGKTDNPSQAVWDLMNEPTVKELRMDDPEVLQAAEKMLAGANGFQKQAEAQGVLTDWYQGQPEGMEEVPFRIGAKKKRGVRKPITRETVASAFPGAKITSAGDGWNVEIGDSFATIKVVPEVEVNWDLMEQRTGKKIPEAVRKKWGAAGAYSMTLPDGTRHSGLGLIRLAEDMADDSVLRHERLHLARRVGLLGKAEWDALVKAHAADIDPANEKQIEERIAISQEAEPELRSVWERVKAWIRRFLAKLGVSEYQARDIQQMMQEAGFWAKAKVPTQAGGEAYAIRSRPDLANPGETAPVREMVDTVDRQRNAEGRPEVRSDENVDAMAAAQLETGYEAAREDLATKGRAGAQLSDVETVMAKRILNREATEAMRSGDPQSIAKAMALIEAYRNTGSEQGRAMRQRRDPVESPDERFARVLSEAILEPPAKEREKRNKARREGDHKTADKINEDWANRFNELKVKLKALGVDLDNLNETGYSRNKAAEILRAIKHVKADPSDKAYEYWLNAILSAPQTQVANVIGNVGHAAWSLTAERLVEATVNLGLQRPEGAQFGEFKYMAAGVLPGLARGARNFLRSWSTESPALEADLGREGEAKVEDHRSAIGGKLGRKIRIPTRLLGAVDDFCKSLFVEMEVGARAYRIAKAEGKTGEALQRRVSELSADIESHAWDAAYDSALELSFQQKGGKRMQALKRHVLAARRDLPGLRYLLPFVTTPLNIFGTAVKKSPLGTVDVGRRMYQNYQDGKPALEGLSAQVAQQVIAWAIVLALLGNDEKDPWITGAEKNMKRADREVGYRAIPPMSVKIGDRYYAYSRIEPFATALGMMVDWVNSLKSGNEERIASVPFNSFVGQMGSKTFLSGVGAIVEAADSESPAEGMAKWAANFSVSWVPNLVRSTSREGGEEVANRRVWGSGREWLKMLGKRTLQKTELTTIQDYPIYDVWGRPAKRSESPVGSDWLYRIMVPVKNQGTDIFVADRLLLNWNNDNPDQAKFPLAPQPYYRRGGETVYMTEGQYADFCRLSGEAARKALGGEGPVKLDPEKPTAAAVEWIGDMVTETRSMVKDRLVAQWSGGDKKDLDIDLVAKMATRTVAKRWANVQKPKRELGESIDAAKERIQAWKERQQGRVALLRRR